MCQEHQLAREEVLEVDELGIALDDVVGVGLEGQADRQAEARLPCRPLVAGLHDAHAGAGDRHPVLCGHQAAELARRGVVGVVLRRARAAEDRDLAHALPAVEHLVGIAHLAHGAFHDLGLAKVGAIAEEAQRRAHHVLHQAVAASRRMAVAATGVADLLARRLHQAVDQRGYLRPERLRSRLVVIAVCVFAVLRPVAVLCVVRHRVSVSFLGVSVASDVAGSAVAPAAGAIGAGANTGIGVSRGCGSLSVPPTSMAKNWSVTTP